MFNLLVWILFFASSFWMIAVMYVILDDISKSNIMERLKFNNIMLIIWSFGMWYLSGVYLFGF